MNAGPGGDYTHEHWLLRTARRARLVRGNGSTVPLAAVLALVCWVPVAVEFFLVHPAQPQAGAVEPFHSYFAMHVMCLLAIPLLVIGIGSGMRSLSGVLARFESSGLVDPAGAGAWHRLIDSNAQRRDRVLPWLFVGVFILMVLAAREWRIEAKFGEHAWQGIWFFHVARPLYSALAVCMLWRLLMVVRLAADISRLELKFVVTHPDRLGGMGFFQRVPVAFTPGILAISSVFAGQSAHQILYHGETLAQIRAPVIGYVLVMLALFLAPAFALFPMLRRTRREGLKQYSTLVARYGRDVHERWVQGRAVESPMLGASELGPATDVYSLYAGARNMKSAPIGRTALLAILLPIAAPLLAVIATQVPIRDILRDILKSVV